MTRVRLAWFLAGVTLTFGIADTLITASFRSLWSKESVALHGWPLSTIATIAGAGIGALIVSRYPRHVIGWLLCAVGSLSSISLLAESYSVWVSEHGGPGSAGAAQLTAWISMLFNAPVAFAGFILMLLLSPDGRLLSRRWRWAAWVAGAGLSSWEIGVLLTPPSEVTIDADSVAGNAIASLLFELALGLLLIGMVAALVCVIIRWRRARGEVRQQLRWIAVWALTLPVGLAALLIVQALNGGELAWLARMPLQFSYALLPVCLGVAVLRYRLYNLDLIINRAVVLTIGTAFAALGYVTIVVGVGALVDARTEAFWPSLLATGAVALAFQPLRRRVIRIADRFAYGGRAVPYEALADFSRQLGASPDPQLLLPAVAQAAVQAVSAQHASVRLHIPHAPDRTATWPPDVEVGTETTELPVVEAGERLGSIAIRMPVGRSLRRGDQVLLADLAGQTALAFRNARLATELASRVQLLDNRTKELTLSRARVIEARDAESMRLERAIRRDVTSHLEHIPAQLAELSAQVTEVEPGPALARMIDESVQALEALRELTRGIYSTQLAQFGLASAISAHLRRAGVDAKLAVDDSARTARFAWPVESAAYFCYVAAARELRSPAVVELVVKQDLLRLVVRAQTSPAPDLRHLQDRLDPLDGHIDWVAGPARSALTITVPVGAGR